MRDAVDETNALFSNRTIRKCALDEAAARAAINAEIAKLVEQAKQEAYKRDTDKDRRLPRDLRGPERRPRLPAVQSPRSAGGRSGEGLVSWR